MQQNQAHILLTALSVVEVIVVLSMKTSSTIVGIKNGYIVYRRMHGKHKTKVVGIRRDIA